MRRIDLVAATLEGWSRLDAAQRERFFKAGLKAALRLNRLEFRAWLLRRVRTAPLAAPIDPASFAISDADMALLLKKLPLMADDADGEKIIP
jgi:hypothetical protein